MFTAPNPGPKTLSGTHTYIVGRDHAYVVDPGPELADYQKMLARWLRQGSYQVEGILLTHGHPDHAPGAGPLQQLVSAPIWASERTPAHQVSGVGVNRRFHDGESFVVDGDVLRVIATPGHTPDHVVFWLEGARILFAGDTILGQGTSVIAPPEGDMHDYLTTLQMLQALHPSLLAPGHGPLVIDPAAKIAEYLAHRRQREEQILDALRGGSASLPEIVQRVYRDIDPRLQELAAASTQAQLAKLLTEGRVVQAGNAFRLVSM